MNLINSPLPSRPLLALPQDPCPALPRYCPAHPSNSSSHNSRPRSISHRRASTGFHEVKHDGYRSLLLIENGEGRVFARNGHDWSDRYPGIVRAAAQIKCRSAIIDGGTIVQDLNGASDFDALALAMRSRSEQIVFYAFDLLHLNGRDIRAT